MEKIENKLIREGWINPNQLVKAQEEQARVKKSLLSVLIKLGFLTEEKVYTFFAHHVQIPYVNVNDYRIDEELFSMLPEGFCREHLVVPLFKIENSLYVAMATPLDTDLNNTLGVKTGMDIVPLFGAPSAIIKALNRICGPDDRYFNLENFLVAPQTLNMIPFWRESERVSMDMQIQFKTDDERVRLFSSAYMDATAQDFSKSGRAMGIKSLVFLPPHTKLRIKFPSLKAEAVALVVRCTMEDAGNFFIGAKFVDISDELVSRILEQAQA